MSPLHALIIDDQAVNVEVLSTLLTKEGVTYTALYSIKQIPPALDKLKKDSRLDGIPIVAYTVHTSEINEIRAAGFHSLLGKPLNAKRFAEQLKRILNRQPVWEV